MPDIEKFYIVNDADMPIIVVTGKSAIHDGLNGFPHKHRSVHILVELGDKIVIQKKGPGTENAGKWSSAASGHVRAYETYEQAAIRELFEEIGVIASSTELSMVAKIKPCKETGNEFVKVFHYTLRYETLRVNAEEIKTVVIVKTESVLEDILTNPDKYSVPFMMAFDLWNSLRQPKLTTKSGSA